MYNSTRQTVRMFYSLSNIKFIAMYTSYKTLWWNPSIFNKGRNQLFSPIDNHFSPPYVTNATPPLTRLPPLLPCSRSSSTRRRRGWGWGGEASQCAVVTPPPPTTSPPPRCPWKVCPPFCPRFPTWAPPARPTPGRAAKRRTWCRNSRKSRAAGSRQSKTCCPKERNWSSWSSGWGSDVERVMCALSVTDRRCSLF